MTPSDHVTAIVSSVQANFAPAGITSAEIAHWQTKLTDAASEDDRDQVAADWCEGLTARMKALTDGSNQS